VAFPDLVGSTKLAPAASEAPTASAPDDFEVRVVGATPAPLRDFYHALLRLSWPKTILFIATVYFGVNALFACGYFETGGIEHARPASFADDFYFSVQTMGTIGYGYMYPASDGANALVVLESTLGLVLTALATGLVFAKFSRPTARVMFSEKIALSPMNGVPTLTFRVGNRRKNLIVEAQIHVALVRSERTLEGTDFFRTLDLKLVRERLQLSRSWNVLHVVDETSPLFGETPQSLAEKEAEILVTLTGLDDTWMQTVHATHRYGAEHVAWGYRLADVLTVKPDAFVLDLRKFHDVVPAQPQPNFPYPGPVRPADA
jgi:inward rectifier potassium channel